MGDLRNTVSCRYRRTFSPSTWQRAWAQAGSGNTISTISYPASEATKIAANIRPPFISDAMAPLALRSMDQFFQWSEPGTWRAIYRAKIRAGASKWTKAGRWFEPVSGPSPALAARQTVQE